MSNWINPIAFSSSFYNDPKYQSILGVIGKSPTLTSMVNALANSGGVIELGDPEKGSSTSIRDGTITVTFDRSVLPGGSVAQDALVVGTLIGHELGHATQDGGMPVWDVSITTPQQAAGEMIHQST